MRLFYYKTTVPSQNFGDELNPWLWPRLLPTLDTGLAQTGLAQTGLDQTREVVLVGIGTMLNNTLLGDTLPSWVKQARKIIFFSTGAGYGTSSKVNRPPHWAIYCVRGPLSARRLKLPQSLAITDGAALLRRFFKPVSVAERSPQFGYMPHFRHGSPHILKAACQQAGLRFIDPASPVEDIITQISRSRGVISEAMHGAIVADTMRVPWLPVRTSPKILPFKWQDWCASLNLPYRYHLLRGTKSLSLRECLYPLKPYLQRQASMANLVEGITLNNLSYQSFSYSLLSDKRRVKDAYKKTINRLSKQLVSTTQATFYLSSDSVLELQISRLEERLQKLSQDLKNQSL
ncbi:MAG: polysaccharide pyruvyl transferase family protein [Cyanobacteria bacterium P01_D01_bin.105]